MSAYVVDARTMDYAVDAITHRRRSYGPTIARFAEIETAAPDAATAIGRALFAMNIEAVQQHYPDTRRDPSNLPGPGAGAEKLGSTYRHTRRLPLSLVAGLKRLTELRYQCPEGDVYKSPLYAELERAIGTIALAIVEDLPGYR